MRGFYLDSDKLRLVVGHDVGGNVRYHGAGLAFDRHLIWGL